MNIVLGVSGYVRSVVAARLWEKGERVKVVRDGMKGAEGTTFAMADVQLRGKPGRGMKGRFFGGR